MLKGDKIKNPRIILNKIKWKEDLDFKRAEIWYLHRGAEKDTKTITGEEIVDIGKSFMKTKTAMIPFHRIFKIIYKEKTIFNRDKYR